MVDNTQHNSLTFSQAQGYEDIPGPLALEVISHEARVKLWSILYDHVRATSRSTVRAYYIGSPWSSILKVIHRDLFLHPSDEFKDRLDAFTEEYKGLFLPPIALVQPEFNFNKILDLLQMIMQHPHCPMSFTDGVSRIFEESRLAYVVSMETPVTIFPAVTHFEGAALGEAVSQLRQGGLDGSVAHLQRAAHLINQGAWAGSISESIHAVESVARIIDPAASKTLGPALASLEKNGRLHPALKDAFSKLYGYTSDEQGIRHALLDTATSPATQDEAVFMVSACASFASYMWRTQKSAK